MRLTIVTPDQIRLDHAEVTVVRAEDDSGGFGVLPHHADFVTALTVSVVSWRRPDGGEGHCAVRGGLLTVSGGEEVAIATREAILGDDLAALEAVVRGRMSAEAEEERQAWSRAEHMRIQAIRQVIGYLRPGGGTGAP